MIEHKVKISLKKRIAYYVLIFINDIDMLSFFSVDIPNEKICLSSDKNPKHYVSMIDLLNIDMLDYIEEQSIKDKINYIEETVIVDLAIISS